MGMFNLKKPEFRGKRFVVIDDSTAIKINPVKIHVPVIIASVITVIGAPVIYLLLKNERGINPDLFAAILFCIIVAWLWTQILNTIVEISMKENKIFFTDYISNLKYLFIPDIVLIEEQKSIITISTKSKKIKINSAFMGITEFIEKLIILNPQIEKRGFNHVN
jgi:hypothetical protein